MFFRLFSTFFRFELRNLKFARFFQQQVVKPGAKVTYLAADRQWVFLRTPDGFSAQPVQVLAEGMQSITVAAASLRAGDQVASRGILTLLSELVQAEGS